MKHISLYNESWISFKNNLVTRNELFTKEAFLKIKDDLKDGSSDQFSVTDVIFDQGDIFIDIKTKIGDFFLLMEPDGVPKSKNDDIHFKVAFFRDKDSDYDEDYVIYRGLGVYDRNFSTNLSNIVNEFILRMEQNHQKQRSLQDFFETLSESNLKDILDDLSDIYGDYKISTEVDRYFISFLSNSYCKLSLNDLMIPDNQYLEVIIEINKIYNRLKSFDAKIAFSFDEGYLRLFISKK